MRLFELINMVDKGFLAESIEDNCLIFESEQGCGKIMAKIATSSVFLIPFYDLKIQGFYPSGTNEITVFFETDEADLFKTLYQSYIDMLHTRNLRNETLQQQ